MRRDHYGRDDELVLVWQADTRTMNPTIDAGLIQREIERDPEGAQAEWLATFRTDLQAAFSPESLEACTIKGRSELPASPIIQYSAFVDPSGGKADSFTLTIGHKEDDKVVIDYVRAWDPPFDPGVVTGEIAEALKGYGVLSVSGDNYGGEWPVASFRTHGIAYTRCEKSKSELYLAFVPVTNSHDVELPDNKRLLTQLRRLERKRGRQGRDSVDHPPRLHDDLANAVAGVSYLLLNAEASQSRSTFNPGLHISKSELKFAVGDWPLVAGISVGDNVVASIVAQTYNTEIRVFFAAVSEGKALRDHLEEYTRAWLATSNAPRVPLLGGYEKLPNPELTWATLEAAKKIMEGQWSLITRPWEVRLNIVRDVLSRAVPVVFRPALQLSPRNTTPLAQALYGRLDEKAKGDKNWHVLNAFSLMLSRLELWKRAPKDPKPQRMPPSAMSA